MFVCLSFMHNLTIQSIALKLWEVVSTFPRKLLARRKGGIHYSWPRFEDGGKIHILDKFPGGPFSSSLVFSGVGRGQNTFYKQYIIIQALQIKKFIKIFVEIFHTYIPSFLGRSKPAGGKHFSFHYHKKNIRHHVIRPFFIIC